MHVRVKPRSNPPPETGPHEGRETYLPANKASGPVMNVAGAPRRRPCSNSGLNPPNITHPGIGDINQTSYQPTPSDKTVPVEVGAMAYPYPLVKDSAFGPQRQARENPYYILRRYGHW